MIPWWLGWMACATTVEPPPPPEPVPTPAKKKGAGQRARSGTPKPKPCLPPPDVTGDAGMAASEGLSEAQVKAALSEVYPAAARCLAGVAPSGTLRLEVSVSCGGVVAGQRVLEAGDWPPEAVACTQTALAATAFPAHALPDGDTFEIPLRFGP